MRQDCTEWLSGSSCGNVELIDNAQIKDINQNLSVCLFTLSVHFPQF